MVRDPLGTEELIRVLHALAEPTRLRLLELVLFWSGPRSGPLTAGEPGLCLSDLELLVGQPHALVCHHLRALRRAGLVSTERRGRWTVYRAVPTRLEVAAQELARAGRQARAAEHRAA